MVTPYASLFDASYYTDTIGALCMVTPYANLLDPSHYTDQIGAVYMVIRMRTYSIHHILQIKLELFTW